MSKPSHSGGTGKLRSLGDEIRTRSLRTGPCEMFTVMKPGRREELRKMMLKEHSERSENQERTVL